MFLVMCLVMSVATFSCSRRRAAGLQAGVEGEGGEDGAQGGKGGEG